MYPGRPAARIDGRPARVAVPLGRGPVEERRTVGSSRRSRDEADFTDVFTALFPQAARVAFRLLGDRQAAEDVAAEAMSRAFARWRTVGSLPHREAWIMRVTTNLALNVIARKPRGQDAPVATSIEDQVATRLALAQALAALPRRQREIIVLRHLAGLGESDIAEALGIGEGTVKTHTKRALLALRRGLGEDFGRSIDD